MSDMVSVIAERLAAAGCKHAFGIPGGEVLAMMNALDKAGIQFVLCKHENAGGFMAEGTHHANGAPGILLATIGPGVVNGVNSIVNAFQDQVPLIVLSGCVGEAEAASYTHQVFDHRAVLAPITKASLSVADGAADLIVDRAIAIAMADPQGPVHLDIPITAATCEQPTHARGLTPVAGPMVPAQGEWLERARERLRAARRPIMLAGVGAVAHGAGDVIANVCERFGMPLLTTYKGKGLLDEEHPLALGGHGLSPHSDTVVLPLLERADLVLTVGYDPIEMRAGWRFPWDPARAIEIAHAPNRHGMNSAEMSFVGNVRDSLEVLTANLAPDTADVWPDQAPACAREQLKAKFGTRPGWSPQQAFGVARKVVPHNTVVTADSGAHRILLSQMWSCYAPRTLLQSSALCTMGCALPLAIGYRIASPGTPVMAVMGDAGLEMVLGELATIRDQKLSMVVLVMVDESLALIEMKQRQSGLDSLGVDFGATNFAAVAQAMGGTGVVARTASELERALGNAFDNDGFTLVACEIGARAYDGAF
jgi:acetolactate synthase-1/2/3 large subunit